jgi:hypothetical protein
MNRLMIVELLQEASVCISDPSVDLETWVKDLRYGKNE